MKRYLIAAAVVLLIGLAGYKWYRSNHLILDSASPKNGSQTVTTTEPVVLKYNKKLDPKTAANFTIDPHTEGRLEVVDNILRYTPTDPYLFNTEYEVRLSSAIAVDGQTAGSVIIRFKPGFVAPANQSTSQREAGQNRTDQVQQEFPILQYIPHETLHYKIDYQLHANEGYAKPENRLQVTITLFANITNESQRASYNQELAQYKKEALDYLRSKNIDLAKYQIDYLPEEAKNF